MEFRFLKRTLRLSRAFNISRGSITEKESLFVELSHDGIVGRGEGCPIPRYGETARSCIGALERLSENLTGDPNAYASLLNTVVQAEPRERAACAAIDAAVMDWVGKSLGVPLYRLWGLDVASTPATSITIAIDSVEGIRERVKEAADFKILKVKLGGQEDRVTIAAIRNATNQLMRVDANEGYPDRETALREIEWLANRNVELVEQPLPTDQLDDMVWLKARSPLPLIADESFTSLSDIPKLAEGFHGINIKLAKCGGTQIAREAITIARFNGLKVMLGCTVESSLGIAAAAHLASQVDYVDLDGNLLISNDPFEGHPIQNGIIKLRRQPGLGINE